MVKERETAKSTAYNMLQGRDLIELDECQEPPEFWGPLGGKQPYAAFSWSEMPHSPRLFVCSGAHGGFMAEEIVGAGPRNMDHPPER